MLEHFDGRAGDLLVVCWETGDGWERFCRFLDLPLPDLPFPHENDHRRALRT